MVNDNYNDAIFENIYPENVQNVRKNKEMLRG
jgi:hypothetical protein